MSDFFDKIKNKVDEGISTISSKSKETVELAKLRNQLRKHENEKDKAIENLGFFVYEMIRRDEYNEQKIRDFYQQISDIDKQIVAIEQEIRKIQEAAVSVETLSKVVCECGAGLSADQKFCALCGKDVRELFARTTAQSVGMKPCLTCGFQLKETAKFCGKCGAKQ